MHTYILATFSNIFGRPKGSKVSKYKSTDIKGRTDTRNGKCFPKSNIEGPGSATEEI